jgi:hypothetical protein
MCEFTETVADERLRAKLVDVLYERKPFRRFRDALFQDR